MFEIHVHKAYFLNQPNSPPPPSPEKKMQNTYLYITKHKIEDLRRKKKNGLLTQVSPRHLPVSCQGNIPFKQKIGECMHYF